MKRSMAFYGEVLGLPLKLESPGWTEFATEGATLALHTSEDSVSADDNQQQLLAGRCGPGFAVPNLGEFHKRMVEIDLRGTQEPKELFGARLAQYVDPDGLTISVGKERRSD